MGSHGMHFSNITAWGPQAKDWLGSAEGRKYGIHILAETHVPPEGEDGMKIWAAGGGGGFGVLLLHQRCPRREDIQVGW